VQSIELIFNQLQPTLPWIIPWYQSSATSQYSTSNNWTICAHFYWNGIAM
jgi:hypothetical protein